MEFQTIRDFQWNKSFEPGLPPDKEILKNPDGNRSWVVHDAICRVLSEMIGLVEVGTTMVRVLDEAAKPKPKK